MGLPGACRGALFCLFFIIADKNIMNSFTQIYVAGFHAGMQKSAGVKEMAGKAGDAIKGVASKAGDAAKSVAGKAGDAAKRVGAKAETALNKAPGVSVTGNMLEVQGQGIQQPHHSFERVVHPNAPMDGKGVVSKLLAAVFNNPAALGATAGGAAGAIHGAVVPGTDEEGNQRNRGVAALTRGALGAAGGGAIGHVAGAAGEHKGIMNDILQRKINPSLTRDIAPGGVVTTKF